MVLRLGYDHEGHRYRGRNKICHAQMVSHKNTPFLGGCKNVPPSHVGRGYKTQWQLY